MYRVLADVGANVEYEIDAVATEETSFVDRTERLRAER